MSNFVLTLKLNGKKKKFKAPKYIGTSVFRKTMELEKSIDNLKEPNVVFFTLYPLICEIFNNQFTPLQLQQGLDVREVLPVTYRLLDHIIENMQLVHEETDDLEDSNNEKVVVSFEEYQRAKRG